MMSAAEAWQRASGSGPSVEEAKAALHAADRLEAARVGEWRRRLETAACASLAMRQEGSRRTLATMFDAVCASLGLDAPSRVRRIAITPLLAPDWYAATYRDRVGSADPLSHFLRDGLAAGLAPNPFFDPAWYARTHGEAGIEAASALDHYVAVGRRSLLAPGPLFDPVAYSTLYGDVGAEPDLLAHFLRVGVFDGRVATPVRVSCAEAASLPG